jgi:predicted RNA-binding Zn-ribbon protein involved in translation (DUF1610 family)
MMLKLSTEATLWFVLAAVVFMIGWAYVFLSPPLVKGKRFIALMWLSLPVSTLGVFLMYDSLVAAITWFIVGVAITIFNNANTFICPKCGALAMTRAAGKQSLRSGKCFSCDFQFDKKAP